MYSLTGLGDTSPCTWWDDVWLTSPCQQYLEANDPNNALLVMVQKGALVGGATVAGTTIGTAAGDLVGSTAGATVGAASDSINQSVSGFFTNPDGSMNVPTIMIAGLGIFLLMKAIK